MHYLFVVKKDLSVIHEFMSFVVFFCNFTIKDIFIIPDGPFILQTTYPSDKQYTL